MPPIRKGGWKSDVAVGIALYVGEFALTSHTLIALCRRYGYGDGKSRALSTIYPYLRLNNSPFPSFRAPTRFVIKPSSRLQALTLLPSTRHSTFQALCDDYCTSSLGQIDAFGN